MTSRWSSSPSSVLTPGWNLILLIFIRMMMMEEVNEEERRMAMWKMIIINLIATLLKEPIVLIVPNVLVPQIETLNRDICMFFL